MSEKAGKIVSEKKPLTLIPYYAWANRGRGEMAVWLARDASQGPRRPRARPLGQGRGDGLGGCGQPPALNDQYEPESSDDAAGYMHWWPKKGTTEWIEYAFDAPVRVSEASVYWFDDTGGGGCRVPASWRVLYKSGRSGSRSRRPARTAPPRTPGTPSRSRPCGRRPCASRSSSRRTGRPASTSGRSNSRDQDISRARAGMRAILPAEPEKQLIRHGFLDKMHKCTYNLMR